MEQMNPEVKALWVEALESGEYKQIDGALTVKAPDGSMKHCCLGVLCELAVKAGVIAYHPDNGTSGILGYQDEDNVIQKSVLPNIVQRWAGLLDYCPIILDEQELVSSLAELNDAQSYDFPRIAALIRQQF